MKAGHGLTHPINVIFIACICMYMYVYMYTMYLKLTSADLYVNLYLQFCVLFYWGEGKGRGNKRSLKVI